MASLEHNSAVASALPRRAAPARRGGFVRHGDGRYDLHDVGAIHPITGLPLIATRAIAASPFQNDSDRIYFAGFDANKRPAHNTAWILRSDRAR